MACRRCVLPRPGRCVEEERVVGLAGEFGDRQSGGVGEAVPFADDELLESVPRVEGRLADGAASSGSVGRPAPPLDDDADVGSEVTPRAALQCCAVAADHPPRGRLGSGQRHDAAVPGLQVEPGEPDVEGRLADDRSQFSSDRAPRGRGVGLRGQRQSTPPGAGTNDIGEGPGGLRPGAANIPTVFWSSGGPGEGLTQSAGKSDHVVNEAPGVDVRAANRSTPRGDRRAGGQRACVYCDVPSGGPQS